MNSKVFAYYFLGLCFHGGKDRYDQPYLALSKSQHKLCYGRQFRVTWGGWSVFQINENGFAFSRLWVDFL